MAELLDVAPMSLRKLSARRALVLERDQRITAEPWRIEEMTTIRSYRWIWTSAVASGCGTLAHIGLMELKSGLHLLPQFDPATALLDTLSPLFARAMHDGAPLWLLSQLNGAFLIGLLFGRFFHRLPGGSGVAKGFLLGLAGWLLLGIGLFPAIGLGPFATSLGLGAGPALFSLAMVEAYSVVLGAVYAALQRPDQKIEPGRGDSNHT
ncbi:MULTISPECIES: hypothetical protein [unclassified Bradyrhizobium]|uniref:hypothetical protein n=1 Tax=unclassified Bradyrhizobium TaxID=2631580 RepID=UPI002916B46D|nr:MULTISPECIES: hypothetical protein [unclassified Bradyrhizobium]